MIQVGSIVTFSENYVYHDKYGVVMDIHNERTALVRICYSMNDAYTKIESFYGNKDMVAISDLTETGKFNDYWLLQGL